MKWNNYLRKDSVVCLHEVFDQLNIMKPIGQIQTGTRHVMLWTDQTQDPDMMVVQSFEVFGQLNIIKHRIQIWWWFSHLKYSINWISSNTGSRYDVAKTKEKWSGRSTWSAIRDGALHPKEGSKGSRGARPNQCTYQDHQVSNPQCSSRPDVAEEKEERPHDLPGNSNSKEIGRWPFLTGIKRALLLQHHFHLYFFDSANNISLLLKNFISKSRTVTFSNRSSATSGNFSKKCDFVQILK